MQLSRTGKKWISVIVTIRPVFPDPVTYAKLLLFSQCIVYTGFVRVKHFFSFLILGTAFIHLCCVISHSSTSIDRMLNTSGREHCHNSVTSNG